MVFSQGARWLARVRVLGVCARRPEWLGAVGTQAGGSGQVKRSETRGGVLIAEYLSTQKVIYILRCTRRPRGMYESGTWLCATAGRLEARPSDVSGLCSHCRNIGATSLLTLDLCSNVAGIGMLHLLATLNSDLRSDVMRRASKGKGRGTGGQVRLLGVGNESCAWAGMYSSRSGWH